ncbi:NAD(P)-binding domain-containing protein [Bacillus horti]|uniref:Thioredoxin reductase n=1 Tax=Caldalkalibacillus horti TaxID=77523 RepID=A0ABT9VXF1_9BACI|nr:NAD(P)-binding domain-containing protein [Bacillus horti]MDQ0165670.1 thioredoxin reductase [Bacillus horti]
MNSMNIPLENQSCCTSQPQQIQDQNQINQTDLLPVAIIGAGPVGLAAAAHLAHKKQPFFLLEAGSQVGANILTWEHVRLFSPWRYNMDKVATRLLSEQNWTSPKLDLLPTGKELVEQYLQPLANIPEIKPYVHVNTKVLSISRKNIDKMKTTNRENVPFVLYTEQNGAFKTFEARAVMDATGTWGNPNPANSSGAWFNKEKESNEHIFYGIPNVLGNKKSQYANKKVAVVGSGHSAINTLIDLTKLKEEHPKTEILWIIRRDNVEEAYGGEEKDALEARGALGSHIHQLVDSGKLEVIKSFRIQYVERANDEISIVGDKRGEAVTLAGIDQMIVNTGNRPNFNILSEIRTSIDTITESVEALAPLIDPNIHSCGTVRPHGEKELRQPEKGFYIVGSKSYGRAPTFLMATGYEQVRSIVAHLTGDFEAAQKVELELPETGVCSVNLSSTNSSNTHPTTCCG